MKIETVKINDLISPDYNPRTITPEALESLKKSIDEFGYIDPLLVNDVNMHVVGGNQRMLCLKELGYKEVEVVFIHEPDMNREKAINIRLNNSSGRFDEDKLESIFEDLRLEGFDVSLTGFNLGNFEIPSCDVITGGLTTGLKTDTNNKAPVEVVEDDYEEPAEDEIKVHVAKGDLFKLDNHYLFCGDATSEKDIELLLNAERERESFN